MCKRDEQIVSEWNEKYPVGTVVRYWRGKKDGFPSGIAKTKHPAFIGVSGVPLVYVVDRYPVLQLSHVEVVEEGR